MHRFSVFVTLMTLLLVVAGALVTSNDAGGAIPDWPLSWGRLVPPLEGGIVYAWGHRVVAAAVASLTLALAISTRSRLAWAAFGLVVAQALVGGLVVKIVAPGASVVLHACLAQLCFGTLVALSVVLSGGAGTMAGAPQISAVLALFGQTILGAAVRHQIIGPLAHIAGAAVATMIVIWAVVPVMLRQMRAAGALLGITAFQVFLGMGAYFSKSLQGPQPEPTTVWFTAAHVAVGSLAFGAAIVLAMAESETGGVVVA